MENKGREADHQRVQGIVMIGGAVKGSSSSTNVTKRAHWIFYLPNFILNILQPTLTNGFINAAFHPTTHANKRTMIENATNNSNKNSMKMCKAFYRQACWSTSGDAQKITVSFCRL